MPLVRAGHALRCAAGHAFDISRMGVVDLRRRVVPSGHYTAGFFRRRREALRLGLFDALVDALRDVLSDAAARGAGPVVDVGCGEGTVTKAVGADVGLDLSLDALRLAASGGTSQAWVAGDLAHLPLADGSAGVLLDVFSPAEYGEFARVAPGGLLVKVTPGPGHMAELRQALGLPAGSGAHAGDGADALMRERVEVLSERRVSHTVPLADAAQAALVAGMSPVAFGRAPDGDALAGLRAITADCHVVVGRLP